MPTCSSAGVDVSEACLGGPLRDSDSSRRSPSATTSRGRRQRVHGSSSAGRAARVRARHDASGQRSASGPADRRGSTRGDLRHRLVAARQAGAPRRAAPRLRGHPPDRPARGAGTGTDSVDDHQGARAHRLDDVLPDRGRRRRRRDRAGFRCSVDPRETAGTLYAKHRAAHVELVQRYARELIAGNGGTRAAGARPRDVLGGATPRGRPHRSRHVGRRRPTASCAR